MFIWCFVLFVLGVFAFLDSIFNMGAIFRQVNSVMFLLISLAILIRTSTKIRTKKIESYEERILNMEKELRIFKSDQQKLQQF